MRENEQPLGGASAWDGYVACVTSNILGQCREEGGTSKEIVLPEKPEFYNQEETLRHYNGPIVRPQTDADSIFIEVTVGCTHNQCSFCNFYEGYPFSVASMQQIEEDLIEASRRYPAAKNLGQRRQSICARHRKTGHNRQADQNIFSGKPHIAYARVTDLTRKSVEEMRLLRTWIRRFGCRL